MRFIKDNKFTNKKIFLRVDFNVPITNGKIEDFTRIDASLPTIQYLIKENAKIIIASHFGRPKCDKDIDNSLFFLKEILEKKLNQSIGFCSDPSTITDNLFLQNNVILLENLRFNPGEEKNDPEFAKILANSCDIYINDAFSCSHRAHASIDAITRFLPSFAGFLLEQEIKSLNKIFSSVEKPFGAIIGGGKISTKLELLSNLSPKTDWLFVGGAMANNFVAAKGYNIGKSKFEPDLLDFSQNLLKKHHNLYIPEDFIVSSGIKNSHDIRICSSTEVLDHEMILDIGPKSIEKIKFLLSNCKTLIFNGPLGLFEVESFANGTFETLKNIAYQTRNNNLTSIAGGGDSISAINQANFSNGFSYISTAGGAFLEWLEGKTLPGIKNLVEN